MKRLIVLLLLVIFASAAVSGCTDKTPDPRDNRPATTGEKEGGKGGGKGAGGTGGKDTGPNRPTS